MTSPVFEIALPNESATVEVGKAFGCAMRHGGVVYLAGTLGAGKTTFCKGVIAAHGHSGLVKSPTYTLVEPYLLGEKPIYHFDLYRLGDPEELEFLGIRDYFQPQNLCLVEWPEKGFGYLAPADIVVELSPVKSGRKLQLSANSPKGQACLLEMRA